MREKKLQGVLSENPPRLPILRIFCQNSPMRNLTTTICLNLALDSNTNVIWEISDRKMNRAERRRQQKRDKKASKDMKSIEPTSEQTKMIEDAVALHQSGQLDLAEIQYKKLLNYLPDNTLLLTNLGTIAFQRGRLEDAVRIIGKSLQINSNQPNALNNRGNALKDLKRLDELSLIHI